MEPAQFATEIVRRAGDYLLQARTKKFEVEFKGGNPKDIVTTIDKEVSELLTSEIYSAYPTHSIYSEEGGDKNTESEYQWVVDPIDGSANFSRGIPHFAICLGLLERGIPIAGAVFNPVTNELFSFSKGGGAYLNGAQVRVSAILDPKDAFALLHAGRRDSVREWGGQSYTRLLGTVKKTSNLGSSSLDACFVAAGRVEANIYGTLTTLDIAPALGLLQEAGGVFCDGEGQPIMFNTEPQRVYMANNRSMLDSIRTLLEVP